MKTKFNLYFWSVLCFMLILPAICSIIEMLFFYGAGLIAIAGKWFVFWGIGARLFSAGLKQVISPGFTSGGILGQSGGEAGFFIRELGFANVCIGLCGLISLFLPGWRAPAAFVGGLYLGLAGVLHAIRKPSGFDERLAMVSDLYLFALMAVYLVFSL